MKHCLILFLITILTQLPAQISFKTDKNQLYTGERFKIALTLTYPAGAIVDSTFYKADKAGEFDKVADSLLTTQKNGAQIIEKRVLTYTSFADSGTHKFALPDFKYISKNQPQQFVSDSLPITVLPLLSNQAPSYADSLLKKVANPKDSSQMILPIMNIVKYQLTAKEKWLIFWFICGILLISAIIYFILKRKKKAVAPVVEVKVKKEPAHLIAQRKLTALKSEKLPDKGEFKEFSVRLSLIIREYLEDRFDFNAAELTSDELKAQSRNYLTDSSVLSTLDSFLNNTDLVKFAKFIPLSQDLNDYFAQAEQLITQTSQEQPTAKTKD